MKFRKRAVFVLVFLITLLVVNQQRVQEPRRNVQAGWWSHTIGVSCCEITEDGTVKIHIDNSWE